MNLSCSWLAVRIDFGDKPVSARIELVEFNKQYVIVWIAYAAHVWRFLCLFINALGCILWRILYANRSRSDGDCFCNMHFVDKIEWVLFPLIHSVVPISGRINLITNRRPKCLQTPDICALFSNSIFHRMTQLSQTRRILWIAFINCVFVVSTEKKMLNFCVSHLSMSGDWWWKSDTHQSKSRMEYKKKY